MSCEELEQICKENHYKISNAERRLRRSESPFVRPVFNEGGKFIVGYKYCPPPKEIKQEKLL